MIEAGLVQLLQADATVGGLVGSRIYDVIVPDTPDYPCMSYQVVSTSPAELSIDNKAVRTKHLQIDCYDSTYPGAKALAHGVINVLEGYSGTLSDADSTRVIFIDIINEMDHWNTDSREYRVIVEIEAQYT